MRHLIAVLTSLFLAWAALPAVQAQEIPADDKAAIEEVISNQLAAFAADNGPGAYAFAAPIIQQIFPDVDSFMAMVRRGYQPVYRNTDHDFAEAFVDGMGRPSQRVVIMGADGKTYEAVYTMERQADGSWKIAGCHLKEVAGVGA